MRVSQILHKMGKDEAVEIFDSTKPFDNAVLYSGPARGVHRDSPLLGRGVSMIMAYKDVIVLDVGFEERRAKCITKKK